MALKQNTVHFLQTVIQQYTQSTVRELNEFISIPSSAHTAPRRPIRASESFHSWQLFSLRACWKHGRAAFHVEMKGSLNRTFTSARLPFFFLLPPIRHLAQFTSENGTNSRGLNWRISISRVCGDWYGRLRDSVNVESVPLEKVTAQPSDCRCKMPKLEGHRDNQEALWKDGLTRSSRRNNTSRRLCATLFPLWVNREAKREGKILPAPCVRFRPCWWGTSGRICEE